MTHSNVTQKCSYSPQTGPIGCLPAPNIFPLAKVTFAKGKMFWNYTILFFDFSVIMACFINIFPLYPGVFVERMMILVLAAITLGFHHLVFLVFVRIYICVAGVLDGYWRDHKLWDSYKYWPLQTRIEISVFFDRLLLLTLCQKTT